MFGQTLETLREDYPDTSRFLILRRIGLGPCIRRAS